MTFKSTNCSICFCGGLRRSGDSGAACSSCGATCGVAGAAASVAGCIGACGPISSGTAAASADTDTRERAWQQVERLALDAAVVAPVLHYRDDLLVADSVEGLVRDPFGHVDLAAVTVAAP